MKVRKNKNTFPYLKVDDAVADLLSIDESQTFIYDIMFRISLKKALRDGGNTVRLSIRKQLPENKLNNVINLVEQDKTESLPDVIRNVHNVNKGITRFNEDNLTVVKTIDIRKLKQGINTLTEDSLGNKKIIDVKPVKDIKEKGGSLTLSQVDSQNNKNTSSTSDDFYSLLDVGIDPTEITKKYDTSISTLSSLLGLGSENSQNFNLNANKILESLIGKTPDEITQNDINDDSTIVPNVTLAPLEYRKHKEIIKINFRKVRFDDFFIVFELFDTLGNIMQSTFSRVKHNAISKVFNTPKIAPTIKMSNVQFSGKNVIEITQNDDIASSVRVERRIIKKEDINQVNNSYLPIAEIDLKKQNGTIRFTDVVNNHNIIQYRCIPVGPGNIIGSAFSNIVSNPKIFRVGNDNSEKRRVRNIPLELGNLNSGIEINIGKIPEGVIAVGILKKNATKKEKEFILLGGNDPIKLTANGLFQNRILDTDVKNDNIYFYKAILYYRDGVTLESNNISEHKFIDSKNSKVVIDISDVNVAKIGDSIDATFQINSKIESSDLDIVKKMLERQGLDSLYAEELKSERSKFENLIAHSVSRIDLTTGIKEEFGTLKDNFFSDRTVGSVKGITPLREGSRYRYIISTMLRDPETMLQNFVKTAVDENTGKTYTFKPAKYLHPITLNKGVIVSEATLASNHPEDSFSFGQINSFKEVEIDISLTNPQVTDPVVEKLNNKIIKLRWQVSGDKRRVEHFIILKENLGIKKIAGNVHHLSTTNTYYFYDSITYNDIGEIKYRVIPVYNDYTRGSTSIAASIINKDIRI